MFLLSGPTSWTLLIGTEYTSDTNHVGYRKTGNVNQEIMGCQLFYMNFGCLDSKDTDSDLAPGSGPFIGQLHPSVLSSAIFR